MKKLASRPADKPTETPVVKSSDPIIAERHLAYAKGVAANKKVVKVILRGPTKSRDKKDHYCVVQILGLGDEKLRRIYGLDSMQALQLALRFVSEYLNPYRRHLRWVGNKDIGF